MEGEEHLGELEIELLDTLQKSENMMSLQEFINNLESKINEGEDIDQLSAGFFRKKYKELTDSTVQINRLKSDIEMIKNELGELELERDELQYEIKNGEFPQVNDALKDAMKEIHPKYDPNQYDINPERKNSNNQKYIISSLNDIPTPSIDLVRARYPEPTSPSYDKSNHNGTIGGIFNHIMKFYPKLIRNYWPEFASWGILSAFIDFPDKSTDYYSSGQKRMLKLANAMINSDPHETILIDEPELSLHIDWQRRFIEQIEVFSGMIIATHSPDILYHHTEKVVHVPP